MPFMIGPSPIRRTLKYLEMGKVIFRETVKIFSINYNTLGDHHSGAREFIYWHLQQIQYKNPGVQCITIKNLTPSPYIKIYFNDGKNILIDIDSRKKEDILSHLENFTAICKNEKEIKEETNLSKTKESSSYFGLGCSKHCMCEIFGQVPCPSLVRLPDIWKGIPNRKAKYNIPPFFLRPRTKNKKIEKINEIEEKIKDDQSC